MPKEIIFQNILKIMLKKIFLFGTLKIATAPKNFPFQKTAVQYFCVRGDIGRRV